MAFVNGVVLEDWSSPVIVQLYKGKGERNECKSYKGINFLKVVGKIHPWILVDKVCRVTGGLIDDEEGGFREGRGCVDEIFTIKQISEKKRSVYGFS